jgi:hypothetical protein
MVGKMKVSDQEILDAYMRLGSHEKVSEYLSLDIRSLRRRRVRMENAGFVFVAKKLRDWPAHWDSGRRRPHGGPPRRIHHFLG